MKYLALFFVTASSLVLSCASPTTGPAGGEIATSSIAALTTKQLADMSSAVIIGRVIELQSSWDTAHAQIHTDITILVDRWIKGKPQPDKVHVSIPGGRVGDISQWVSDAPNFHVGEAVLLFLEKNDDGTMSIVGGTRGKLVIKDEKFAGSDMTVEEFVRQIN